MNAKGTRGRAGALLVMAAFGCAAHRPARLEGVSAVRLAVAQELVDRRQYGEAIAAVQQLHGAGVRTPETLTLRAIAYREQGLRDDAEADLAEALRLDPDHAPAHAALAVLQDQARRFAEGDKHHRRAVELDAQNATYLSDWGYALYQQGRLQDALTRLQAAVRLDPLPARYHNNLGFVYARAGDFTRAAQQFALGGSPAEAKNNLGYAYELAGNLPQAYEAYAAAVRLGPGLRRARANLEDVARKLDRPVPADLPQTGPQPPRAMVADPPRPEKVTSGRMQ